MEINKKEISIYIFSAIAVVIIMTILFSLLGYTTNQGFNPSDEGVVLSQSWRILNGEIPHKDFISIRPVGSGILHQLDFIFPFPLLPTSRMIAVFEYILISIIWAFLLIVGLNKIIADKFKTIIYPVIILLTIILNLNNGPIFTWTTTDSLLFNSIGLLFLYFFYYSKRTKKDWITLAIPVIFFASLSALCRQSFALTAFLAGSILFFNRFTFKSIHWRIFFLLIGCTPLFIYFYYLIYNNAFSSFIQQMSGRTELFETGFITYGKSIFKDITLIFVFVGLLFLPFYNRIRLLNSIISKSLTLYYLVITIVTIFVSVDLFLGNNSAQYAFYFFWLLIILMLHILLFKQFTNKLTFILIGTLVISWTSSISIGDNSPRPYLGPLAVACITILVYHVSQLNWMPKNIFLRKSALVAGTFFLLVLSFTSMSKVNYRDWAAPKLKHTMNDIIPGMGKTKINDNTRAYFNEFSRIYKLLDLPIDHFTMVPNNAFIYGMMESRNPLTLDWMQHHEYIGAEEQFTLQVKDALNRKRIYLFVDKVDSKLLYKGMLPFNPDLTFNHSYIPWLAGLCERLPIESPYFEIYVSK